MKLRQSDAHALVELWLEGEGWQRVDPALWAHNFWFDSRSGC